MDRSESENWLAILTKRGDLLSHLCDQPAHKRDLVDELDHSRSTIDRSIRELETAGFVERCENGVTATVAGRLAVEYFSAFHNGLEDIATAAAVVDGLPVSTSLPTDAVIGTEAILASEPAPYQPLERVHDTLAGATRYRAILPALDDPRHVRLLYEHVVTRDRPAELVVTEAVLETLREEFPRRLAAMAEHEQFRLFVADEPPPFALCLADEGSGATASVVVFADSGTVHGVLHNQSTDAVRWGRHEYEQFRADATDRTAQFIPRGKNSASGIDGGVGTLGRSLSVALEREGFLRLDISYLRDEPVADPTTAWRAGLSLAEVHTGYTVDREGENQGLTEQLSEQLADGQDSLVVGPPGAGKSTLCKRVACAWYEDDHGPVLYREQGRGRPFESVDDLVASVDTADGHTLVVVEDAVRPETSDIFTAIDRLADRDDVSFLLDARESEWLSPAESLPGSDTLEVVTVPTVDETDCRRLLDHFERTTGERVSVPAEQLWEEVRAEITNEETAVSGMLLLLHRLSTYADPLSEGQTSLEETVEEVHSGLDDDLSRQVCILANTLNAAGIGVDRDALYAVADPDEFGAVDAALDALEGKVLFARPDGSYRTVHESWSVTYLASLLETDGEDAAARAFGEAVTRLLTLVEQRGRRERIKHHLEETPTITAIENAPEQWLEQTVETLYTLGHDRPKLACLFGDGDTDSIELPAMCPAETASQVPLWLGETYLAGGYYDAGKRAFERLAADRPAERLLGLARIATETGSYDEALTLAEQCQAETGDRLVTARCNLVVGRVLTHRGEYDRARTRLRAALDGFEAAGDRRRTATVLDQLGRAARDQGSYEDASEFHERSLRLSQRLGDRAGETSSLTALGAATFGFGEYDRAREYFERSLDLARTHGNRSRMLDNLKWLGSVFLYQSEYDRAREYCERALETARELGCTSVEVEILGTMGLLAERVSEYDRARKLLEETLDRANEIGDSRSMASRRNNLGLLTVRMGNHDEAENHFQAGQSIAREHGHRRHEANSLNGLGHVARMRGEYERAREFHEEALTITQEIENRRRIADSYNKLGFIALRLGEYDRARERFQAALDVARDLDHPREEAKSLRGLAECARNQGADDEAAEYAQRARDRIEPTDVGLETEQVRLVAARVALDRSELAEAGELGRSVRDAFEGIGAPQWTGRAEQLLGRIATTEGDLDQACEYWERALDRFDPIDAPEDTLQTLELLLEHCDCGEETKESWRDRVEDCLATAPSVVVDQHERT